MSISLRAALEWRWLGGWQAQVFLFGILCAWPFWLFLGGAVLDGDFGGYAPWLAFTGLMFAGWAGLVVAHPSRYAVTQEGIGLRSFCGMRWIGSREISRVDQVHGEESAGTILELKSGEVVGISIAFHGVSIHGEIDTMLSRWDLPPAKRTVTAGWDGPTLGRATARGVGLEKWESGLRSWSVLVAITLGVGGAMLIPAWLATSPPAHLAPWIAALLSGILAIVLAVMVAVGRQSGLAVGWRQRLTMVARSEWPLRWHALSTRLALSQAPDSTRHQGAWAANGGVLVKSVVTGEQPFVPSGQVLVLFSLRSPDTHALAAAAQAVEEMMLDPLPPVAVAARRAKP